MGKYKQTRRSVSMNAALYDKLDEWCTKNNVSRSAIVTHVLSDEATCLRALTTIKEKQK